MRLPATAGLPPETWLVAVENQLIGKPANEATFQAAAQQLLAGAQPHEHNAFKVKLAQSAIVRALQTVA
ncbi:MAG: hypothetical protein EOO39_22315 [Cytophagaceae bacterium]|nr:MAG: hypothetical protein EOO39_22315 [Cytophagaceae bacterium]